MKNKMKAAFAVLPIFFLTILTFSGCERIQAVYGKKETQAPVAPPAPVYAVNTIAASQGTIQDYLSLAGDIVSSSAVDVYSDAAGKVSRISVAVGSRVGRGDPIIEVDPSRPGMDYVASVVKAPVAGTVVSLAAQLGMTVSQQVPLARIAGGGGLEIRLYVAERFISRISLRQSCDITLDAWPGEIFRGRISEISPVVDPSSRTMEIRISVDNAGSRLKAGMFAKVRIVTEQKDNIVKIPSTALLQRFGEDYVFIAEVDPENPEGFTARKKIVVSGIHIDGVLEIQQGLKAGDNVIVRGQALLDDGTKVNIVERLAPLSTN
jgi:multidrug efflux pump subunit AcrA (membrane-fusion protein)